MAFSSLKPCSRLVRGSPHQTDQQQKEVYYLLQDHHEQQHQEEQVKDHQTKDDVDDSDSDAASWKALQCDEPPQIPSTASEPSYQEELPTFIAHQGFHPLKLQQNKECKHMVDAAKSHVASGNWFRKERSANGELLSTYSDRNCESQVYFHTALPPVADVPRRAHKFSFMRMDPKKQSTEQDHHNKQRPRLRKNACAISNIYGITGLDRAIPMREEVAGVEKRRNSSASVQDVICLRKVVPNKGRCHVDGRSSSWEEEVRQAMARSLIGKKQDEGVHGLQRSTSVKEYGTATEPPTLSLKTTGGSSEFDWSACPDQAEPKPNDRGGHPSQKKISVDKSRLWRGFNVKSPRAERWEEAAEVEEQQELQRRAGRSQSLRYDTSGSAELMGQGRRSWDTHSIENAVYHDDEWAVYKRNGYANMRPRTSGAFAPPACCSSLLGRSLSMRDTRMGLVMECAFCGAALRGAGGCLLCFCSCCAAARASSTQGGMATPTKKKGGILRACRRLLGLGKKGSPHTQM